MKIPSFLNKYKPFIKYYLLKLFTTNEFKDELDLLFKYFLKIKRPKYKVMFDVGAHLGEVSYNYLKANFKVYAFEPDLNRNKIEALNNLKKFNNFHFSQLAASDTSDKELDFYTSNVSTGISSALKFHNSHMLIGKVKTIALRDFIFKNEIKGIDFIKIDTEGYDFYVIKGLALNVQKPSFIICEYENEKSKSLGYNVEDMINYLKEYGYKIIVSEWHPIKEYGKKHNWKQFLFSGLPDENSWGNIFAVQPEYYDSFFSFVKELKIN